QRSEDEPHAAPAPQQRREARQGEPQRGGQGLARRRRPEPARSGSALHLLSGRQRDAVAYARARARAHAAAARRAALFVRAGGVVGAGATLGGVYTHEPAAAGLVSAAAPAAVGATDTVDAAGLVAGAVGLAAALAWIRAAAADAQAARRAL